MLGLLLLLLILLGAVVCVTLSKKSDPSGTDPSGTNITLPEPSTTNGGPKVASEKEFLNYFGKDRLMIGVRAPAMFFKQNKYKDQWQGRLDVRYTYIAGGLFAGPQVPGQGEYKPSDSHWWGWWQDSSQAPGQCMRDFMNDCQRDSLIPMVTYYMFCQTSHELGIGEGDLRAAQDVTFMQRYFNDFRFLLQQIGDRKAMIHIEPDLWAYSLRYYEKGSTLAPAQVKKGNPLDGAEFADDFAGFAQCLISMVRKYAPNTLVGLHASSWEYSGEQAGNYLNTLGAAATDFVVVEVCDRDADYKRLVGDWDGQMRDNMWQDRDYLNHFSWVETMKNTVQKPVVWWQLPLGHADSPQSGIPQGSYETYEGPAGWKDNRVDYLLNPDHHPFYRDKIVAAGGVLLAFGDGHDQQTNPCTDGGHFLECLRQYRAVRGY
jgi:hypothetical protein